MPGQTSGTDMQMCSASHTSQFLFLGVREHDYVKVLLSFHWWIGGFIVTVSKKKKKMWLIQ